MCYIIPKSCSVGTRKNYSSIGDSQALEEGQEVRNKEEIKVFRFKEVKKAGVDDVQRLHENALSYHPQQDVKDTVQNDSQVAMKMKHYLSHTDYLIWKVIQNGNGHVSVTTDTNDMIKVLPLKTAEEVVARERERKARTTLLMALLEDHLAKFHKMADAKEIFEDLYNNLRVFERDVKGTTASSSSNTHNVAFVSADNTSSTNDLSTAYSVSSPSVLKSQKEGSSSYTDEVIHSFFTNQLSDDLEQINDDDLEKMDLKCRRRDVGYNGNKVRDNGRRHAYQDDLKAIVTINGENIDWSGHAEEDTRNYAMMAYSFSTLSYDNE
nr:xylulose kinase-1 [Tanacetum cinerariifolium]